MRVTWVRFEMKTSQTRRAGGQDRAFVISGVLGKLSGFYRSDQRNFGVIICRKLFSKYEYKMGTYIYPRKQQKPFMSTGYAAEGDDRRAR